MSLRKHLIASLAMAALTIPAAGASFVTFAAAPAFAKGGKGGGGGGGGGGGKSRGSEDRGGQGKSGKGGGGFGQSGQGGLARGNPAQGNGNGGTRGQAARGTTAAATAPETAETAPMRPNELGSMNGALHANINAVLAHIRNGNTNGPVGALAGLAVADDAAADAQDVIDKAAQIEALDTALEDAGYESLDDYQAAVEAGDIDPIQVIEDASTALGDTADETPPTEEEIAEADAALAAQSDAEAAIFAAWNKSGEATEDEKAALLEALRDRLDAERDAIGDAIDATDTADAAGDGAEGTPDGEGDPLDPDIQAMIDNLTF